MIMGTDLANLLRGPRRTRRLHFDVRELNTPYRLTPLKRLVLAAKPLQSLAGIPKTSILPYRLSPENTSNDVSRPLTIAIRLGYYIN